MKKNTFNSILHSNRLQDYEKNLLLDLINGKRKYYQLEDWEKFIVYDIKETYRKNKKIFENEVMPYEDFEKLLLKNDGNKRKSKKKVD